MPPRVVMVRGDIVTQDVDAIVNAANTALRPGGGVDGAITRAAGPDALADRERLIRERGRPPLATGTAIAGSAGRLRATWIIYTAGPVYSGSPDDARQLARCHRSALAVADELGAASVAFPAISTGVYGYPVDLAAPVAVESVMREDTLVNEVRFVLFDDATLAAYADAFAALNSRRDHDEPSNEHW
jgi:O-acetyl-ADP-ribose deacetylase (regulator of RNase III)